MSNNKEGLKYSNDKIPLELVPVISLIEAAKVLDFGQKKYGRDNWRKGIAYSKIFGALLRHLYKWYSGEEIDKETGLSHLSHALVNVMFLIEYRSLPKKFDDRPKIGKGLFEEGKK